MKTTTFIFTSAIFISILQSCTTIHPGEIGLKIKYGKLKPETFAEGRHHSGFGTHFIKFSTRIKEVSSHMNLPTKEGLEAKTDLSLLYHIKPEEVRNIYLTLGLQYEKSIVLPNFQASAREACLNYSAMNLLVQRDSLETTIKKDLTEQLGHYGFVIDQILVRDIDVPDEIDAAIEKKVLSEQLAKQQEVTILTQKRATEADIEKQRQEMEFKSEKEKHEKIVSIEKQRLDEDFSLEKSKKEAERSMIEAEAAKKVQSLANSTITPLLIQYKTIDVMKELANSPNSKIIITDGKTPLKFRNDLK